MSKVTGDFIGFSFLRSVIGPENSYRSLDQPDAKLKPDATSLPAFSRALGSLVVFTQGSF